MENFSDYFKNKDNKREFIIAIIVIIIIGLLTAFLMLNTESGKIINGSDFKSKTISIDSTKGGIVRDIRANIDIKNSERDILVSESAPMVAWIDSLETQGVKNTIIIESKTEDLQVDTTISNTINKQDETIESTIDSTTESNEKINIENNIESSEEVILSQSDFENKNNLKVENNSHQKLDDSNNDCVIVLGAFSNKRNLDKLKARLLHDIDIEKLYIGKRKGYKAIGVYINCEDEENQLEFFRRIYNKKAWILKVR